MYYYFVSKFPAVLKIDGVYHGEITQKIRKVENLSKNSFIEVYPLELGKFIFPFILNEKFLLSSMPGVSIVDLKGGYLIEFNFLQSSSPFQILAQEKLPYAVVTAFKENGLKVSIETPNDFFAETVPFYTESAKITPFSLSNKHLIAITFLGKETLLNCYILGEKIQKVFCKKVCDVSFQNGLSTTEEFFDIAKHKLTCYWALQNDKLVKSDCSLSTREDFSISDLPEHVIGYAFLEELLCGGDVSAYLAESIRQNKDFLNSYFGEFLGVMPPPDFRKFDEIGLIYKCAENRYNVEYFSFVIEDKKICNIKKAE